MKHREVTLDDKYELVEGKAYMTGIQALVRLPLDRKRMDLAAGHKTGGFISGYRGSPLGGYDQQLRAVQKLLDAHDIKFWEGLNEDLGATAVWGSQQLGLFPGAKFDGLFGIWYGKAPGVDRTGDVFKHANAAGTSALGGVLAVIGDDHNCKSSTLPSQSEYAMQDAEIPTLNPASIQDVLDYGIHGWEMSRFSGAWVGLVALADTMDSGAVVNVDLARFAVQRPAFALPEDGVHMRRGDVPLNKEARLRQIKLPAAQAYVRANRLDHVILPSPKPRVGVIVTGQAARDVFEALAALGLTPQEAGALGLSVYKVAMPWPLEPQGVREFCAGLERVIVIEHKRPLIESQLKAALYDLPETRRPVIEGKRDANGAPLLSDIASLTIPEIAGALMHALPTGWDTSRAEAYFDRVGRAGEAARTNASPTVRSPHFCSGCPHNTSTVVPEGSRALAGIGCHYMANFMPDRKTDMTSQMGGEGIGWVGQHWATDEDHVFVNLGDGTYSHSGSLAIRAAVTSGANMTYKILYNDAVAMTGGQHVESGQTPAMIAQQVEAEGVKTIRIVTEDPTRYAGVKGLPRSVKIYHRDDLEDVQVELRQTPGVSVIIYDQMCATEKRRRSKRGMIQPDRVRTIINTEVCEGCGDCSVKSNCLSVEPVETELGRKRRINQSTCNTDLSCLKGFCPSFVTIKDGEAAWEAQPRQVFDADGLPLPETPSLAQPWNILFTGVGGTGVTTVAAVLAMAAHVDGNAASSLDMTGLAQKGGSVFSHIRIADSPEDLHAVRIATGAANAVIGGDVIVTASVDALAKMAVGTTRGVVNCSETPTSDFTRDPDWQFPLEKMQSAIAEAVGSAACDFLDAHKLATTLMGDAIATNLFLLGYAWQKGWVPVSEASLDAAIVLNGAAIEMNRQALLWGRRAAVDPAAVEREATPAPVSPIKAETLDERIARRAALLTDYQDAAYARRYLDLVARVRAAEAPLGSQQLTEAVLANHFKLLAYKDEYEVARLFSDPAFRAQIDAGFEGDFKVNFHLAPTFLARPDPASGRIKKITLGPWMESVFRWLTKFRRLRGTPFDVFGYHPERKAERALITQYEADIALLLDGLNAGRLPLATEIASLPDGIRGYGHIKAGSLKRTAEKRDALLAKWNTRPHRAGPGRQPEPAPAP